MISEALFEQQNKRYAVLHFFRRYGTLLALGLTILIFSIFAPRFLTLLNFFNISRQIAVLFILGVAETYALIDGEIDLSIGQVAGIAGIIAAGVQSAGAPTAAALAVALAVGLTFGIANGIFIAKVRINSLITTIGIGQIAYGITFLYTKGAPITGLRDSFISFAAGKLFGVPFPLIIILVVFLMTDFHLRKTASGRLLYAVGYNPEASVMSGLKAERIKVISFAITGLFAGLGGFIIMARMGSGQPTAGPGHLGNAIAVGFLGASVLREGEFHTFGTLVGAIFVGILVNGLTLFNVPYFYQFIATGVVLLGAVMLAAAGKREQMITNL
jgi:ribose/xylose/arabinose/galactoside ABC-type transport system permease subunit